MDTKTSIQYFTKTKTTLTLTKIPKYYRNEIILVMSIINNDKILIPIKVFI